MDATSVLSRPVQSIRLPEYVMKSWKERHNQNLHETTNGRSSPPADHRLGCALERMRHTLACILPNENQDDISFRGHCRRRPRAFFAGHKFGGLGESGRITKYELMWSLHGGSLVHAPQASRYLVVTVPQQHWGHATSIEYVPCGMWKVVDSLSSSVRGGEF